MGSLVRGIVGLLVCNKLATGLSVGDTVGLLVGDIIGLLVRVGNAVGEDELGEELGLMLRLGLELGTKLALGWELALGLVLG